MNQDTSTFAAPRGASGARTRWPAVAVRLTICGVIGAVYAASFFLPVSSDGSWFPPECGGRRPCHAYPPVGAEVFSSFLLILIPRRMDILWIAGDVVVWVMLGYVVWFANPALWLGTVLLAAGRWRGATVTGVVALILGIAAAVYYVIWTGPLRGAVIGTPDPDLRNLFELRFGYYLWLASMALLAGASAFRRFAQDGDLQGPDLTRHVEGDGLSLK